MSEHSVGYKTSSEWVTLERHTALFRDPTNKERRFIPLRLDDVRVNDALKQFAYVDWRERDHKQYARLVEACQTGPRNVASASPTTDRRLFTVAGVRKVAPLDRVLVDERGWIDAAACKEPGFGSRIPNRAHFVSSDCVVRFEVDTTFRRVVIDDVVVRILSYEPPPKIRKGICVAPAMPANLYTVEIDSPQNSGTQTYYGGLVSNSPLDYVVVTQNEPEVIYVMTAAITPGIYKFSVGIVVRLGNDAETEWVTDFEVYFTPSRDQRRTIPRNPIDILKARNDKTVDLWDVHRAICDMAQNAIPNAAEELKRALLDSDNPLNHQLVEPACVTLAKLQGPESFEMLVRVFSDARDAANIWGATAGLLQIDTEQSTVFLIRCLRNAGIRDQVLFQLARATKLPDAIVPVIVNLATDSNDRLRVAAVQVLGQTSNPLAISTLLAIVRDQQLDLHAPQLRAFAAEALGKSAGQVDSTVAEHIGALTNSGDPWVKRKAVEALASFRQQAAKVALREALRDPEVRVEAAKSLALVGDEQAFALIVDLAETSEPYEKTSLIESLIELATVKQIPDLLMLWEHIPPWVGFEEYMKSQLASAIVDRLTELTGERLGYYEGSATITANSNSRLLARWRAWTSAPRGRRGTG